MQEDSFLSEPPESESESRSVMFNSLQPHGLYSPWDSPGQNTGVGSLSLLQGSSLPRDRTQVSLKGRRGEIVFRIKFHTHQRCSESSTTKKKQPPCVHQYPGIPQETGPDLLLSVSVSPAEAEINSGLPWGQGLWLQQTWEVHDVSPTIEPPRR